MAACSLDWTVRTSAGDASPVAEAGPDVVDATASEDADARTDAPVSADAAACEALALDLKAKKAKAQECQIGTTGQCTSKIDDECGCGVIVRAAGVASTTDYTSAIAAYVAACGTPPAASCACPQLGVPASWACLANGPVITCRPP
jgi:hypothetical protein